LARIPATQRKIKKPQLGATMLKNTAPSIKAVKKFALALLDQPTWRILYIFVLLCCFCSVFYLRMNAVIDVASMFWGFAGVLYALTVELRRGFDDVD